MYICMYHLLTVLLHTNDLIQDKIDENSMNIEDNYK